MLAKRKGALREGWSEGSVEQNCDPTNRNRIRGGAEWTSCLEPAKSISIKTLYRISGGCAAKADELTPGDLCRCSTELGCVERRPDRGTEVSRGHSSHDEADSGPNRARAVSEGSHGEGPNGTEWQVGDVTHEYS